MILKLNSDDCDLLLYHSFYDRRNIHGISGHLFEILDYYQFLKSKIKVKCLFYDYKPDNIRNIINNRYINSDEFNFDDFIFGTPDLVYAPLSLNTDGSYDFFNNKKVLGFKLAFNCGAEFDTNAGTRPDDVIYLEDSRIYPKKHNSIHYVKKIALDKIKKPLTLADRTFAHITHNCKEFKQIDELLVKYPNLLIFSDYLPESEFVTNKPVKFGDFNKFLYTPVGRKFDCSPRLIAECDYLGIPYEFYNINYKDIGLETRLSDIKNNLVNLKQNDDIIDLILDIKHAKESKC